MTRGFMKKVFLISVSLLIAAMVFAQSKYKETDAVVLQNGCMLFQIDDEGRYVDTKETLGAGAEIKVKATRNLEPKTVRGVWISGRTEQSGELVQILYRDVSYYILNGKFAVGMVPGIITVPSAALYRTRNLADIKNSFLTRGTIVAVGNVYDIVGGIKFTEIAYYSSESGQILRGYVRADRVSDNRDDIKAIEMLTAANNTNDFSRKRQIISSVKDLNVTGNVLEMIGEAEMRVRRSSDLSLAGELDVPTQVFYYAEKGGYVNIRDMPSTSGNSVGTVGYDEDFTVIRRTARSQTLYGITDFWYYGVSADKVDGWIFGGFLTPRPKEEEEKPAEGEAPAAATEDAGTEEESPKAES